MLPPRFNQCHAAVLSKHQRISLKATRSFPRRLWHLLRTASLPMRLIHRCQKREAKLKIVLGSQPVQKHSSAHSPLELATLSDSSIRWWVTTRGGVHVGELRLTAATSQEVLACLLRGCLDPTAGGTPECGAVWWCSGDEASWSSQLMLPTMPSCWDGAVSRGRRRLTVNSTAVCSQGNSSRSLNADKQNPQQS